MNNPKLKLAMAKLLPEMLYRLGDKFIWCEVSSNIRFFKNEVLETEWLYVLWLIRKDLTQEQKVKYLNVLRDFISKTTSKRTVSDFDLLDANFDSQAEAMCKVKGIDYASSF